jgi:hypothetical protein
MGDMEYKMVCVGSVCTLRVYCSRRIKRIIPEITVLFRDKQLLACFNFELIGRTYIRPNESMPISMSFCFMSMCRSYTIHVGITSASASVITEREEMLLRL